MRNLQREILLYQLAAELMRRDQRTTFQNVFNGRAALLLLLILSALASPRSYAQLAITEIMSSAATNFGPSIVTANSDFWELTNFGTNTLNLKGFTFTDADHPGSRIALAPTNTEFLFIRPSESILFVRDTVSTNESQVRDWWGTCLGSNVQIYFYRQYGLSRFGDHLTVFDPMNQVVDKVRFGVAFRDGSFVYDTNSGVFGTLSHLGDGLSCRAVGSDDIGSPGRTSGRVPLRIVKQPTSTNVYPNLRVTFKVEAFGMSPPRYQWFFKGNPVAGAVSSSLTVTNATTSTEGEYDVEVFNGLEATRSASATLSLSTNPLAPTILVPPLSTTVLPNRAARFSVAVAALPVATYQWFLNGAPITGATNPSVLIPNAPMEMSGSDVCVLVQNRLGGESRCAKLFVNTIIDLRFTEVQADPHRSLECADHEDWFELTNFGTNEVQLLGYRFSDRPRLGEAFVIDEPVALRPGESMIFVNESSVGSFIEWWGAENLPPGLKVYPYSGFSLRREGETLFLWNEAAEQAFEWIEGLPFAVAAVGISDWFNEDHAQAAFGVRSVPGLEGAFRAVECGDIGSPGFTTNPPPRILNVTSSGSGVKLRWRANEGRQYHVEFSPALGAGWTTRHAAAATNSVMEVLDSSSDPAMGFYRIRQVPP